MYVVHGKQNTLGQFVFFLCDVCDNILINENVYCTVHQTVSCTFKKIWAATTLLTI